METNDNSHWKFGIFYYNKDDKRIFCPKRIPMMGWTINFANPYSIIIISLIVAVAFILGTYTESIN